MIPGTARGVLAADFLEHSRARDGQHHHARSRALAFELVDGEAECVAEDQLLERDARAEPQRARTQAADRTRRDLEHRDAVAVDAQLGMDRPVGESDRARRAPGEERHVLLHLVG